MIELIGLSTDLAAGGEGMSDESLRTSILAAIAIALLLQTALFVWVGIVIYRVRRPFEALIARTSELLEMAERSAERVDHALERIEPIIDERAEQADVLAKELLDKSRMRARELDELFSQCLRKLADLTETVETTVKRPLHEARALGAGFRAGIECLFSKRPRTKERI